MATLLDTSIKALATTLSEPRANKYDQYSAIVKNLEELSKELARPYEEKIASLQAEIDEIKAFLSED